MPLPASQRVALDVGAEVTLRATLAALDEFQVELVPERADYESSPEGADDDAGSPFELAEGRPSEEARPAVNEAIAKALPPEFVNRIDQIVLFHRLAKRVRDSEHQPETRDVLAAAVGRLPRERRMRTRRRPVGKRGW